MRRKRKRKRKESVEGISRGGKRTAKPNKQEVTFVLLVTW